MYPPSEEKVLSVTGSVKEEKLYTMISELGYLVLLSDTGTEYTSGKPPCPFELSVIVSLGIDSFISSIDIGREDSFVKERFKKKISSTQLESLAFGVMERRVFSRFFCCFLSSTNRMRDIPEKRVANAVATAIIMLSAVINIMVILQ